MSQPPRSHSTGWAPLLIALLFFGPVIAAVMLYQLPEDWWLGGRTNAGDLIDPARSLPEVSLGKIDGSETSPDFLKGKWTLIFVGGGECGLRCQQALVDMRQIRLALGKDMGRVQRVFLFKETCCDRGFIETEHPGLIAAWADEVNGKLLLESFPQSDTSSIETTGRIYLVDPLGNLMMSYAPEVPAKGILEDLEHLLRLSRIG